MIGNERLEVIAEQVGEFRGEASCAGDYVLAAQELLYGSHSTQLSRTEWRELQSYLARREQIATEDNDSGG
jgi:hypothetical protein